MCKGLVELLMQINKKKKSNHRHFTPSLELDQVKSQPRFIQHFYFFMLFFSFAKATGIFKLVYRRGNQKILPALQR